MKLTTSIVAVALAATGLFGTAAQAETDASRAARAAWADRHVRLVCEPLEAQGLTVRARRCYGDVARARADASIDFSEVTASTSPARTIAFAGAAAEPDRMNRCAGVSCLARFPTIGVGY